MEMLLSIVCVSFPTLPTDTTVNNPDSGLSDLGQPSKRSKTIHLRPPATIQMDHSREQLLFWKESATANGSRWAQAPQSPSQGKAKQTQEPCWVAWHGIWSVWSGRRKHVCIKDCCAGTYHFLSSAKRPCKITRTTHLVPISMHGVSF